MELPEDTDNYLYNTDEKRDTQIGQEVAKGCQARFGPQLTGGFTSMLNVRDFPSLTSPSSLQTVIPPT